jgi:hypothetical protein
MARQNPDEVFSFELKASPTERGASTGSYERIAIKWCFSAIARVFARFRTAPETT